MLLKRYSPIGERYNARKRARDITSRIRLRYVASPHGYSSTIPNLSKLGNKGFESVLHEIRAMSDILVLNPPLYQSIIWKQSPQTANLNIFSLAHSLSSGRNFCRLTISLTGKLTETSMIFSSISFLCSASSNGLWHIQNL